MSIHETIKTDEKIYIVGQDMLLDWLPSVIDYVIQLWNAGVSVWYIAEMVKRDSDEVAFLIIDLKRNHRIDDRPGGAYGKSVKT